MSVNTFNENSEEKTVRFGTQIEKTQHLEAVEEDQESENFEFNPYRISENADDAAIENFLAGNPNAFAKPPDKKTKRPEPSEKPTSNGFTSTRWHDQAEKASNSAHESNGFTQTRWHDQGESQYSKRDEPDMSRASIFSTKSAKSQVH